MDYKKIKFDGERMKDNILTGILKAQISNKDAEKLGEKKGIYFVLLFALILSLLTFPFIRQRTVQSLYYADASNYSGFGAVMKTLGNLEGDFHVENDKLYMESTLPERMNVSDWLILFDRNDNVEESFIKKLKVSALVLKRDEILISVPSKDIDIKSGYSNLSLFSRDEIRKASNSKQNLVLYIQGFLFAFATQGTSSAIVTMMLLMAVQYISFVLVVSVLFTASNIKSAVKAEHHIMYYFASSLKIITGCSLLPAVLICIAGIIKPSVAITYGWLLFSFATGLRLVVLYLQRLKPKSIVYSV